LVHTNGTIVDPRQ